MARNYQLTNYINIYKHCHWGQMVPIMSGPGLTYSNMNIVNNRNQFITEFNIKKSLYVNNPQFVDIYLSIIANARFNDHSQFFDHIEAYRTNDNNVIIITSPYYPDPPVVEGFRKIYNLYSDSSSTYIQTISKQDIKMFNNTRRVFNLLDKKENSKAINQAS